MRLISKLLRCRRKRMWRLRRETADGGFNADQMKYDAVNP